MTKYDSIYEDIKAIFLRLGFEEVLVNGHINYKYGELYCVAHPYTASMGFFIEYAHSRYEAMCYAYEDGDRMWIGDGRELILEKLEAELRDAIADEDTPKR